MKFFRYLAATALMVAASCGGGSDYVGGPSGQTSGGTTGGTQTGGSNPVQTNAVSVSDNTFSPSAIQVGIGTTVTWTWSGATSHNVTFTDGAVSGDKLTGTYSRTFSTAGTFNYHCTLHPGMDGSVKVQ